MSKCSKNSGKLKKVTKNLILAAVKKLWNSAGVFDFASGEYQLYFAPEYFEKLSEKFSTVGEFFDCLISVARKPYQSAMTDFFDFSTMLERLEKKSILNLDIETEKLGWIRLHLILLDDVGAKYILFGTQGINEEIEKFNTLEKESEEYLRIMANLSEEFEDVYLVDLENDTYVTMSFSNIHGMEEIKANLKNKYSEQLKYYSENLVLPEYQENMLTVLNNDYLINYFKDKKDLTIRYKLYPMPSGRQHYEIHLVKVNQKSGCYMVMGFRCIEDIIAKEEEFRKKLRQAPREKEHIISQLTRLLYGFNITLDVETGTYTVIEGSGMEKLVKFLKAGEDYRKIQQKAFRYIHPAYRDMFKVLTDLNILRNRKKEAGIIGSLRYQFFIDELEKYEWHEINVFSGIDDDNNWIVNILCRDITKSHEKHERNERELRVTSEKNMILSELTKMLFSYNVTVNLDSGKYNVIIGNDENALYDFIKNTDDYVSMLEQKMETILPEYQKDYFALLNIDSLRVHRNLAGFIGSMEYGMKTASGTEWIELNVFITIDEFGTPYANVLGKNITEAHRQRERKILEQQAAAAHDKLFASVTKMIYGLNATVNLKTWRYSLIVGSGMEPVVNILQQTDDYIIALSKIKKILVKEYVDKFVKLFGIESLLSVKDSDGLIGSVVTAATRKDKIRWQETSLFIGKNEDGDPVANILSRDITDMHEREDTVRQLEVARAANEAKSEFLSKMSHDIRTPINGIMGMLKIAHNYSFDKERVEDCFKKIDVSANYLLMLINDILDLNKLETGKMELARDPIDISSRTWELYNIVNPLAEEMDVKLEFNTDKITHTHIIGSVLHVKQILVNLISNAIKYNKRGGKVLFTVEEIFSDSETCILRFVVSDTGIGMTEEFQKKMFDSFVQENRMVANKYRSSGLGLSIVKRLVELMSGKISVHSQYNVGSEFTVELPFMIDKNPRHCKQIEEKTVDLNGMKVLLVEDIEINMEIAKILLEDSGCEVVTAENGREAVELFTKSKLRYFDVVLMDIMMPEMDGYEATRKIRTSNREDANVPIIAMTANAFTEDIQKCLNSGMDGHVAKPFKIENLVAELVKYKSAE